MHGSNNLEPLDTTTVANGKGKTTLQLLIGEPDIEI